MATDDQLALRVGRELRSAFLDDTEFRAEILKTNNLLNFATKPSKNDQVRFGLQSAFNSFIVSSYHATRSIERMHKAARDTYREGGDQDSHFFFLMQHSFCLHAIMNLYSANQLFRHAPVVEILKDDATKICEAFDADFPNLKTARDALAHDDERVFGLVKRQQRGDGIKDMKFTKLSGAHLEYKDEQLRDAVFKFPSPVYLTLLSKISEILTSK